MKIQPEGEAPSDRPHIGLRGCSGSIAGPTGDVRRSYLIFKERGGGHMSRRTLRVLGLTLIVAMIGSAFVANADAKKLSKSQKHAISKKLLRAVKHNPKV